MSAILRPCRGTFGDFGGMYVPEILTPPLDALTAAFETAWRDPAFRHELDTLLRDYAGRETPLYRCRSFGAESTAAIYLKREDLVHGGAHKTNQAIAQALLARRMGKRRLIAETGAGQHGVATAMAGALMGLETRVYMGEKDMARQSANVHRMRLMGAEVVPVTTGSRTLKDAINEALRDWAASYDTTHYLLGTVAGPHPYPTMVREFQRVIGDEARRQILEQAGRLPDVAIACVGGGSNALGLFTAFLNDDEVRLVGVEPSGLGLHTKHHGATLQRGRPGILHGCRTYVLQDDEGQIRESYSISAGLDYPAVGPEHAYLRTTGRVSYVGISDAEAVEAYRELARAEGILPALESAHALAYAKRFMVEADTGADTDLIVLVNLSGRGDKDLDHVIEYMDEHPVPVDAYSRSENS